MSSVYRYCYTVIRRGKYENVLREKQIAVELFARGFPQIRLQEGGHPGTDERMRRNQRNPARHLLAGQDPRPNQHSEASDA